MIQSTKTPVAFVDPRAEAGAPIEDYNLTIDLTAGPATVGLVANGFPDSEKFLDLISDALQAQQPHISVRRWNKHNASATISDAMLDEVVAGCDAVIAAYGH